MNTVCQVCGNIGFKHLLICCRDCRRSAVHQYCLDIVVFDASLADWLCDECLQQNGEVCCYRSLEVSSYADFRPTVQQPVTKWVESESDAHQCQNILDRATKLSSINTNHENQKNQHAPAMWKNVNVNVAKDNKTVVGAHSNKYWAEGWPRHNMKMSEVCDVLMLERENEEVEFQLVYNASKELQQRSISANVPEPSTLPNNTVEKDMPYSSRHACDGIKNLTSIQERNMDFLPGSPQHDKAESPESSEIFVECQKYSYHHGKTVKVAPTFLSSQDSGEDVPSEKESLELDDLQSPPGDDYVLSRTSYLSEAQKKRVVNFIKKLKHETTVFVAVMRKSNVQPPGPCLGISKEYAFSHFPHTTTKVTLQRPGKNKKWYPIFYRNDESRKNMLMGQWLDFVRENHVQEGDICLLVPGKGEGRSMFMVYLVQAISAHSRCRASSQSVKPCPGGSIAKTSSEVHMEEPTDEQHISSGSGMRGSSHGSLECEVSHGLPQPLYIVPCRNRLSKSQKMIVEATVTTIQSDVPICVAIMKNNNAGVAQRWMLELCSRYASVHLPAKGQTMVLQCGRKVWETKMMYHTGRRWTLNGGWPQFARDNGLRVGDICLFELKKNERNLTMRVHIISTEQL